MKMEPIKVNQENWDGILYPVENRKDKVMIVMSGSEGVSKGAEYALAAAIAYPELSCVIVKTPSWFYSEGLRNGTPSGTSCWSFQGKELAFTPYKVRKVNIHTSMFATSI